MGRFLRKFKGIGEIAVMDLAQVGVRTRARALAMADAATNSSAPVKRRKVGGGGGGGELDFSSSLCQLEDSRQLPENSAPTNDQYSNPSSDHVPASCCSSNGSTEASSENFNFADLEEQDSVEIKTSDNKFCCRERRQISPLNEPGAEKGELESTARPATEASSRRQSAAGKMPSEDELEEFFAVAEKNLQKQFMDKYNYDIVKDEPSDGRYEWVRLKP